MGVVHKTTATMHCSPNQTKVCSNVSQTDTLFWNDAGSFQLGNTTILVLKVIPWSPVLYIPMSVGEAQKALDYGYDKKIGLTLFK